MLKLTRISKTLAVLKGSSSEVLFFRSQPIAVLDRVEQVVYVVSGLSPAGWVWIEKIYTGQTRIERASDWFERLDALSAGRAMYMQTSEWSSTRRNRK